jgi:hypothetical protein
MNQHGILLERMASISPGVRSHLGGEFWQQQIPEDEIDSNSLVIECFSVMVDEAYEMGLEFFCLRGDLCDTTYHLDLTLLLFETVYPTPLYRNISENMAFKNWIVATIRDGGGNPDNTSVIELLEFIALDYPDENDTFYDTYVFLQDKLKSTPVFDLYVLSILETDVIPFSAPIDVEMLSAYLASVKKYVERYLKTIDVLHSKVPELHDQIQLQYNRVALYKQNVTAETNLDNYTWAFHLHQNPTESLTLIEQALLARFTTEFEAAVPFYEEYFKLCNQTLTRGDAVSLIIGCLMSNTTRETFAQAVDAVFTRLTILLPKEDTTIRVFITQICLTLSQEFFS